jgi:hypothetical protein
LDDDVIDPPERPSELVDLQGGWRRDGRTLAGNAGSEVTDVLWLQVGRYFCDLRIPRPGPGPDPTNVLDLAQAFSGTVALATGAISFRHDLDSLARDPAHPDEGTVHRQQDVMYERGIGFEERWVMTTSPSDPVGIAERPSSHAGHAAPLARLVRIGPLALVVWGGHTPGGAQYIGHQEWTRQRVLHECDESLKVDGAVRALVSGGPLPDHWVAIDPGGV